MKKVVATAAPEFRSHTAQKVAWAYTSVLTVMAALQLFAFEKFLPLLQEYGLPGGDGTVAFVGGMAVITEIFALPFLLRMRLSPLMRLVSMACCAIAPLIWLVLASHALMASSVPANGGMFGTKATVSVQLQFIVSLVGVVMAVYLERNIQAKHKK